MKEFSSPIKGMVTDVDILNQGEDSYIFALNAMLESNTGDGLIIQNDYSNLLGAIFNDGENVIAKKYIPELDKIILFTTNNRILALSSKLYSDAHMNEYEYENGSTPVEPDNNTPILDVQVLADSPCFNWSILHKVDVVHKLTNSTLNLYFVDGGYNEDRYIYFNTEDLSINDSFKRIIGFDTYNTPIYSDEVDCNKLKWYPEIPYPSISTKETEGGNLLAGVYQFLVAFSTSKGIPLTSYKAATNPFPLSSKKLTSNTNYNTGKAIELSISNVDPTGRYRYVNIVVASTIDEVTTFGVVGTFAVDDVIIYTFTGDRKMVPIDELSLFITNPFYRSSEGITKASNKLFKFKIKEYEKFNLQPVINNIKLKWFTVTGNEGDYGKPEFAQNYRTYVRDEVYTFGVKFILDNGEETQVFSFINQAAKDDTYINNLDSFPPDRDRCDKWYNPLTHKRKWKVYNTAKVTKTSKADPFGLKCEEQYQEGDFAYWESTETYPNDVNVWAEESGQPMKLFKMPDCLVSPIHNGDGSNVFGKKVHIYPLGVKLDDSVNMDDVLQEAINLNLISLSQKNRIRGYKIVRGNRVGNESVIAKGWLSDVWAYLERNVITFYPNHGFNDLRPDPYLASQDLKTFNTDGSRLSYRSEFNQGSKKYTLQSPDTSFRQPSLGNILKLESEVFGSSEGFFSESRGQGSYVVLNQLHYNFAIVIGYLLTARLKLSEAQPGQQGQAIGSGVGGIIGGVVGAAIGGVGAPLGAVVGSGLGGIIGRLVGGNTANDDYNKMYQLSMWISQTDRILELLQNTIPLQNYHWQLQQVGDYNNTIGVANAGFKQREIVASAYVDGTRQLLPNNVPFNNNFRESTVYLEVDDFLPPTTNLDNSKFTAHKPDGTCYDANERVTANVASYYASIKRDVVNQYGNINNIEWIPVSNTMWTLGEKFKEFGGDQFINRFGFKRSHSFFTQTSYNLPDRTDIYYEDYPNIAFPIYFFNTKYTELNEPANISLKILSAIENSFPLILALNNIESPQSVTNNPVAWDSNKGLQDAIGELFKASIMNPYVTTRPGRFYLDCSTDNFVEYLSDLIQTPASSSWWKNTFGEGDVDKYVPNMRFNFSGVKGKIYTYNHAIPYFICESNINLDLRHAENANEKDFYPHVTDLDYWLQEENVSPKLDNVYLYNRTYSKQNKEELSIKTDINFFKEKDKISYENRIIYSQDGAEVENAEFKDNYLYFRPLDVKDFSFENGKLTSVDALESGALLIRFENSTGIIPNTQTLVTQEGVNIALGNGNIFNQYQEFAKTDLGYIGSQHTDILNTEFGHIVVDAKRGNIFNIAAGGKGINELSKDGMKNWFIENLPFKISKYFKNINTDNSYNNIGITMSYDKRYRRFFITKLDYAPIIKGIKYINNKFYYNDVEISLRDRRYFCNASWTISYSFYKQTWTSFHTFTPNYYIDGLNLFYTGLNGLSQGLSSLWIHNLSNKTYQKYYNVLQPFIIEVATKTSLQGNILNSVSYLLNVVRYHNDYDKSKVLNIGFSKAIVYNEDGQNSGLLNLNILDENKLSSFIKYPYKNPDSTDISLKQNENVHSFNQFSDISEKNNLPRWLNTCNNVNKTLNLKALNYGNIKIDNNYIRGQKAFIRLINDVHSDYKFIFRGLVVENTPSG